MKGIRLFRPAESSRDGSPALRKALTRYGSATQLSTLLAFWPRVLYVASNGRLGSLQFSARSEGKALAAAALVGDIDARYCGRDRFSAVTPADTAKVVSLTSADLNAEINAYMNSIIMRSKMSEVGSTSRLPLRTFLATLVVVGIVVVVDWFMNEPLVERLQVAGNAVHVMSIMIALASLIFAHYLVVGTPPGRRNRTRMKLIGLAIFGFLIFVVPGAYLRTASADSATADVSVGLDAAPADVSIASVLKPLVPIGVMLGLMLFTTAVAALIALRNESRKDEIRDDGSGAKLAALLTEAQVSTARALHHKVYPLTERLIASHTSAFNGRGASNGLEIEVLPPATSPDFTLVVPDVQQTVAPHIVQPTGSGANDPLNATEHQLVHSADISLKLVPMDVAQEQGPSHNGHRGTQ